MGFSAVIMSKEEAMALPEKLGHWTSRIGRGGQPVRRFQISGCVAQFGQGGSAAARSWETCSGVSFMVLVSPTLAELFEGKVCRCPHRATSRCRRSASPRQQP